jgi:hypothetical protein
VVVERSDPSGLLIVKVRLRVGASPPRLLAAITTTLDLATREEAHETAHSVAETLSIVERWLEAFVSAGAGDGRVTEP